MVLEEMPCPKQNAVCDGEGGSRLCVMGREAQGTPPLKGHLLDWRQAHKADVLLAQASRA